MVVFKRISRQAPSADIRRAALGDEPPRDIVAMPFAAPDRMGWGQAIPGFVGEPAGQRRRGCRGGSGLHPARVGSEPRLDGIEGLSVKTNLMKLRETKLPLLLR